MGRLLEKKKFFDYVDKNYKGEKEEQVSEGSCDSSKKKKYEYVELDEAKVSFVFHDKAEAKQFATKVKSFVDNVEIQKIASVGHDTKLEIAIDEAYNNLDMCCKYRDEEVVKNHQ